MGLGKRLKKAVSGAARTVGKTVQKTGVGKVTQAVGKGARTAYAATGGGGPLTGFAGLFLQPEQMGIKSKQNQRLFTRVQQGGRIAAGAAGAYFAAPTVAGMLPSGAGSMLGKGALATLKGGLFGGGGFGGPGGGAGGGQGGGGLSEETRRLMGRSEALIGRQEELAGASPEAEQFYRHQATQALRAGQAERGIYESGVGAAQEAELSPQIEEQIRRARLGELAGIAGQYEPLYRTAAMGGEEPGSPWAGMAGQFAGNVGYNLLSKYFGGK